MLRLLFVTWASSPGSIVMVMEALIPKNCLDMGQAPWNPAVWRGGEETPPVGDFLLIFPSNQLGHLKVPIQLKILG